MEQKRGLLKELKVIWKKQDAERERRRKVIRRKFKDFSVEGLKQIIKEESEEIEYLQEELKGKYHEK